MKQIVLASNNAGKIREFNQLLHGSGIVVVAQADLGVTEVEETGLSFVENAIIKARHAAEITKLPAIADDSGLCVSYLGGEPGIYSARYAGEKSDAANNRKLLDKLANVSENERAAAFHCVLVFMTHAHDPAPIICDGVWHGKIAISASGDGGFGYDPIFYVPELNKTSAELPAEIKNQLSHRGIAMRSLLNILKGSL